MHSFFTRGTVAALLLAPAFTASVHAGEVRMFDRPPTVSEVQDLLAAPAPAPTPAPAPRYRSIEIIGGAVKSGQNNAPASPTAQASFETPEHIQVMPASVMAPKPIEEPAVTPPAKVVRDHTAFGFRINFRFDSAVI